MNASDLDALNCWINTSKCDIGERGGNSPGIVAALPHLLDRPAHYAE